MRERRTMRIKHKGCIWHNLFKGNRLEEIIKHIKFFIIFHLFTWEVFIPIVLRVSNQSNLNSTTSGILLQKAV